MIFSKIIVLVSESAMLKNSIEENWEAWGKNNVIPGVREAEPICASDAYCLGSTSHIASLHSSIDSGSQNSQEKAYSFCSFGLGDDKLPNHNFLLSYPKIDLLIIDSEDFKLVESHKIKTIINISDKQRFSADEIKFSKPFILNKLLKLIANIISSKDVFCAIGNDLIYNDRLQVLKSLEKNIKLTEKENEIFKAILLSPNFELTKELLLKNIWQYHADSESLTVDTHLYKLKAKLPGGMLEIKNNICRFNIS